MIQLGDPYEVQLPPGAARCGRFITTFSPR